MTAVVHVDSRGIMQDIGGFGIYQKILCVVVVGMINGLCAMSFATQLFSLVTSDHWCWNADVAALEEQLPLAREDTKKFSIPVVSTGRLPWSAESSLVSFSQCQRYDGDLAGAYVGWVAAKRPHTYVPLAPENKKPYGVRECDQGWVYNHTFHTLTTENNWVCNSKWKPYALHTASWVGASVGACVLGHIANSFGRRVSLIAGTLLYFIGGVSTLLTSGFILLLVSRFIIGMGHLITSYLALILVLELCDERHRVITLLAMMMAHNIATLLSPWMAYGVTSWWWLTLIPTILSAAVCFTLTRIVPESPWWMFVKGHQESAIQLLYRIAKVNRKEYLNLNHTTVKEVYGFWTRNHRNLRLCCLQNNSNSRNDPLEFENLYCYSCKKEFIITDILWVLCGWCYYGHYYTSTNLLTMAHGRRSDPLDSFFSYWYAALMEIPICILPFILQGCLKVCQMTITVSLVCAAVLSICYAALPTEYTVLSLTLGLITRSAVAVAYYSTVYRRWEMKNIFEKISAWSTESLMGLALAIIPSIIYVGEYYSQIPSLVFGITASLTAAISVFLPLFTVRSEEVGQYKLLQRLRKTQFRKHMMVSATTGESQGADATHIVSTVPYNPLEST